MQLLIFIQASSYLTIINERGSRVFRKKLPNDPKVILEVLGSYRNTIVGIAVESTYNWYWIVDTLMEQDYAVHLANPRQYRSTLVSRPFLFN